jgi:small subunit ribosomal protein S6
MRNYEVVIIVQPDVDETALTGVVDKVKGWITESGGTVAKVDMWGKRRMAYAIRKQHEGQYVLVQADMAPTFNATLDRNLHYLEPVMRYLITAVE